MFFGVYAVCCYYREQKWQKTDSTKNDALVLSFLSLMRDARTVS